VAENEGIIFNIQRYSIHDGPGIRTTVFLKGCPLICFWCQNPESQNRKPEILLTRESCTGCGLCTTVCPNKANSIVGAVSTIFRKKCTGCGKCIEVCPNEARTIVGKPTTVDKVVSEVLKDKKFYANSGGGVTLSGGEPTAQPFFALAILRKCKENGLHTTIETCGYAPWSNMQEILSYTDLFLYDIKCIDPAKHKKATGKDNDLILSNVKKIAQHKPVIIRVPLIPNFNADITTISEIAKFVKKELGLTGIDLLTYNKFGESKYERLGQTPVTLPEMDEELISKLRSAARPSE
jgi:pyruvate formate lyase activating enzyme